VQIPDYETIMLPLLNVLADGNVRDIRDVRETLGPQFHLSDEDLAERIPSGRDTVFRNRVGWATTYLKKAGVIEPAGRGQYCRGST
jgi:restriction system protein